MALFHWRRALGRWSDREGSRIDLEHGKAPGARPGLQGAAMWLSIVFLVADLLGVSEHLGYRPKGVHRPEVAFPSRG